MPFNFTFIWIDVESMERLLNKIVTRYDIHSYVIAYEYNKSYENNDDNFEDDKNIFIVLKTFQITFIIVFWRKLAIENIENVRKKLWNGITSSDFLFLWNEWVNFFCFFVTDTLSTGLQNFTLKWIIVIHCLMWHFGNGVFVNIFAVKVKIVSELLNFYSIPFFVLSERKMFLDKLRLITR